jgi:hypothetical protein
MEKFPADYQGRNVTMSFVIEAGNGATLRRKSPPPGQ